MNFDEFGLSPALMSAIADVGYTAPTPIQEKSIPLVLMGRDLLGCAQTGTGKTASFTLPMIEILAGGRAKARMPRSLILTPTRELAAQVAENFELYGKYSKLSMALLVGGESMSDQRTKLDRGVDVLIATPGRLIDLFERGAILLSDVKVLVIDEADRMLDMGFIPDVEKIINLLPRMRQTLMFSATLPPEVRRLAERYMMNPKEVSVAPARKPASESVVQGLVECARDDKREALRRLIRDENVKNAFIFCNRKRDVAVLHKSLQKHGFNAGCLHGDMPQPARTATLAAFKAGQIQLLVCSDVAARGLDIDAVSHVFNFDVPNNAEDYVHRIGRTGRAGLTGRAFTLSTREDWKLLAAVEKLLGNSIPRVAVQGLSGEEAPAGDGETQREERRHPRSGEARRGRDRRQEPAPSGGAAIMPLERERAAREEPDRAALRQTAPRPQRRDEAREDKDDRKVVGFGDHVPAFLERPVALRA
jgi:superfamily II DNA/RNA helicase